MLAVIPYTTFPTIELGPLHLKTFGFMVALGVLLGAWIAAAYGERFGISRDETYRTATWMVLAGLIGSRLTWAITHTDQIHSPVDVIAIWQGGIQFSGGFIFALVVGLPFFRKWSRIQRWQVLDGYALGLALGLAIGRIGCYSVGEHFGRTSNFFLATRYDGGSVREPSLGDIPLTRGTSFHNTALYEFIYMLVLFAVLGALVLAARRRGREVVPGTLVGIFIVYYGIVRWLSDSLRVNDERIAGMTGAQWMCLIMIPAGLYILWHVRPSLAAALEAKEAAAAEADAEAEADSEATDGDEAESATESAEGETDAAATDDNGEAESEPDVVAAGTDGADSGAGVADDDTTVDGASDDHEATVPPADR